MPAINVARTDTFEKQRQKINQIGDQIFSISQGGSDLATGNLKIGNGTRIAPSLAFSTEETLGLYRPEIGTLGFIASQKKLFNISEADIVAFRDFKVQQSILQTAGLTITDSGSNYDVGIYGDISLTGGTGAGATASITVVEFEGTVTNLGANYSPGSYASVTPIGGNGSGALISFEVEGVDGNISDQGSAYAPGQYSGVSLTGGNGSGAIADIDIIGDTTITGNISNAGSGYEDGTYSGVQLTGGNGSAAEATITVASNIVDSVQIVSSGLGYQVNDVLSADPTFDGIGNGSNFAFTVATVTNTGYVSNVVILDSGQNYQVGDVLSAADANLGGGGGSGFEYTVITSPGIIQNLEFTDRGTGYQTGDVLTLGSGVTGLTAQLKGQVFNVATTVTSGSTSLTVADTTGIVAGMDVVGGGESDVGTLAAGTTAQSVNSGTSITLSAAATGTGAITLSFTSQGTLEEVSVTSVVGIGIGDAVTVTGGTGAIAIGTTISGIDSNNNTITLSQQPTTAGTATITLAPVYGSATTDFEFTIGDLGIVSEISVTNGGNGYTDADLLSAESSQLTQPIVLPVTTVSIDKISFSPAPADSTFSIGTVLRKVDGTVQGINIQTQPTVTPTTTGPLASTLDSNSLSITVSSTAGISAGDIVSGDGLDVGQLADSTTVANVVNGTTITLSTEPAISGGANLTFATDESGTFNNVASTSPNGSGATFDVIRSSDGQVQQVDFVQGGTFYQDLDVITIAGNLIGGTSPAHDITVQVSAVVTNVDQPIHKLLNSGGNTDFVYATYGADLSAGDQLYVVGNTSTLYTVNTSTGLQNRWFIDTGSGAVMTPNLTLYSKSTYQFDLTDSSNAGHQFLLSEFRDGPYAPSNATGISATLDDTSTNITVSDASNLLVGMEAVVTSGSGALNPSTLITNIVGNVVTLSEAPATSGFATLEFKGTEYTNGVVRSGSTLTISVIDTTPNLYYTCEVHPNMGGEDNDEATITIDLNNPKVFGSGLQITADSVVETDVILSDIESGTLTAVAMSAPTGTFTTLNSTGISTLSSINANSLSVAAINGNTITVTTSGTLQLNGDIAVGSTAPITLSSSSGDITTSGVIKTFNKLNVNNSLTITNNDIASATNLDIKLTPATGRVTKVDSVSAITIPAGNTNERPPSGVVENGSIRFNTDSSQYEGYSASTNSWASLGGVRDIDGNTYILAELTAGSNDNILYFYNDGSNTLQLNSDSLDFRTAKNISSTKLGLPSYSSWTANTAVATGDYLRYKNNVYEVTSNPGGTTASSGNAPTHTTGAENNGSAQLTWSASAVSPLTISEVEELRVCPDKDCPLIIGQELKLDDNTISTQIQDLVLKPNAGKQTIVDSVTHFRIPAGTDNEKSIAAAGAGSIRFNTTIQQFEGYSGTNWSSLGGVRDVDGNTYIIPETAPAANENILYFYNNNVNTLQLSATSLDFTGIDNITTSGGNSLALNTEIVTFNSVDTTIDNSDSTSTFISGTKQYLDLGLSSGLNTDPILRLDDQGDVYLNTTFGSGSFNGVKIFDGELKEFELADYKLKTSTFTLDKGGLESSAVVLYPSGTSKGCEITVVSKSDSGKRSMSKYSVIDNGTDIFHNEYASLNTSSDQYTATFDYTASTEPRITLTLSDDHNVADIINFTVLVQEIK